ncbi:hypothetical protein THARTR1_09202 [Trichoderma harzianum]|uniref:Heterokaryon incompatibility domain-containing protein n=1 Tax=Trichoderma harzianum TaxID=5544 RepID=A0A2K0TWZ7_TRIHA|nr:hypothetical protein THARTR1_09202 [Trichoderma harzianum]
MDLLCEPSSPATPPRKTPYVCTEAWDGGPFLTYPVRKGMARVVPPRLRHHLGAKASNEPYLEVIHPTPKEEIQPILQTWLWFGLLAEMLGLNETLPGHRIIEDDLATEEIRKLYEVCVSAAEEDGKRYISAKSVLESSQIIAERMKLVPDRRERFTYMRDCLQFASLMMLSISDLDETVRYSICALGEYFSTGLFQAIVQSTPKIDVPVVGFSWHQNYMQSGGTMDKQMLQQGWCPSEIEKLRSQFQGLHTMHHIAQLQRPNANQDHSNCTRHLCTAFQMNIETYKPSHLSDGCSCDLIGIDERATSLILRSTDTYPIIRFDQIGDGVGDFELVMEPYEPGVPYVALSHVWANGLGNPKANSLPRCQIKHVAQLIASMQAEVETGDAEYTTQYRMWIDTLCCPVELGGKLIALERIASVYRNASHVLVLDASLTGFDPQDTHPAELMLRVYGASPWMRRLWTLQEGALTKSLYVQFADKAVNCYALLVKLWNAGNSDPRYMKIWQDIMGAYNELQGFFSGREGPTINQSPLITLQRSLQFRTVSVPSDEPLCISTLMNLDTKYIAAAPDAETRMARVWELINKSQGGLPMRVIFYADEVLSIPGWRWAPRSLLGSAVKDPVLGIDERVLRLAGDANNQGIPTPLGLKVALPGCRLLPRPLVAGLPLHPWPGAINPTEDQILLQDARSGKWYRIMDWYRSKKIASWTAEELSAFDREQNHPLCREADSGKCVLIYDEKSRVDGTVMTCMGQIEEVGEDFEHASVTSAELQAGLRIHRTRAVIMSALSDEEIRMMTIFREMAGLVAMDQETSNLQAIEDRESEDWKSCMAKVKDKMKEVVAEAWKSRPEVRQTVENTIGLELEEYMWAFIPKVFSHDVMMEETPSEQLWFVD